MKTIFRYGAATLAIVAAIAIQGCGWGVNGLDRMDEKYPKDAETDAVDVIGDAATDDMAEQDIITDTAVAEVADDAVAGDTVEGTDANVWPDVSYEGIEGLWAVRLVSSGVMTVPIVGERPMRTTDLFLATGSGSSLELTFCDELIAVEPTADFNNSTTTKQALRDALASNPLVLATAGNAVLPQDVVWKWAVSDSIADETALPAADKDNEDVNFQNYPDIDSDSHPGVTIDVSLSLWNSPTVGERYMAKRVKFSLAEGAMSEDGRWITGAMTFAVDEVVLGADQALLNNGAAVAPLADGTFYQFRRVDDLMDCAALVANNGGMFQDAP